MVFFFFFFFFFILLPRLSMLDHYHESLVIPYACITSLHTNLCTERQFVRKLSK